MYVYETSNCFVVLKYIPLEKLYSCTALKLFFILRFTSKLKTAFRVTYRSLTKTSGNFDMLEKKKNLKMYIHQKKNYQNGGLFSLCFDFLLV